MNDCIDAVQNSGSVTESIGAYVTSAVAFAMSHICWPDVGSFIMGAGSFVLLAARLVVDVPRAWESIKKRRKHVG